jgi:hypothetical protein
MANSRDFTGKNRKFTGTKGIVTPKGTTGERIGFESGELRFNTSTELMEYYDGNQWKPIDAPPSIASISTNDATGTNTILNADGSTLYTITINGGNFGNGVNVQFIGSTGTVYTAGNITRVSASQITCTTLSNMGLADDPYDVKVINVSGLSVESLDAFSYNAPPVFVNAAGQIASSWNGRVFSGTDINVSATDAEGNTITYSIVSGSLPGSGLSLSSSTGYITGTQAGSPSNGNYTFVVRASTTEGFAERQFTISVVTEPTIEYLLVGGGGGGGGSTDNSDNYSGGGGGGAGGFRTATFSGGTARVYTVTVGGGAGTTAATSNGASGTATTLAGTVGFSTITASGGGGGGRENFSGTAGGSGGGGGAQNGERAAQGAGGAGNTPSTSPSQGNNGGEGRTPQGQPYAAGGGGGAGQAGQGANPASPNAGGQGGNGTASSITGSSVTYAGGGGGGTHDGTGGSGGSGGGGRGGQHNGPQNGAAGTTNLGGGGGGAGPNSISGILGGGGGKGVAILKVPTVYYSGTTTGSPTVNTSGDYKVIIFNDSGTYTDNGI